MDKYYKFFNFSCDFSLYKIKYYKSYSCSFKLVIAIISLINRVSLKNMSMHISCHENNNNIYMDLQGTKNVITMIQVYRLK